MSRNKMIVVSLDAVGSRDLPYLNQLPNFKRLWAQGAGCGHVESVYPSLTYPAHTSIITGRFPASHGIVNNLLIQPERVSPDWFWQRRYINGTTLYDEAERAGLKVAALLWPVTGKADITFNLPEVFPNRPWQNQVMISALNGTLLYELDLLKRFGHLRKGVKQPELDNFVQASLLYTLKKHQPDLTLVHFTDVDTNRHQYGVEGPCIQAALERHDKRLGEIVLLIEEMGWKDSANLVILGDHCQRDVNHVIYLNDILAEYGYLTIKDGKIKSWKAVARDCDGACYIYVKDPSVILELGCLLKQLREDEKNGILHIYTGQEAAVLGADPNSSFMLEAREGYYFQNSHDSPLQAATHGYLPDYEDYQTVFLGIGPDFKAGARISGMRLVDEGPTIAAIMNLNLGEVDGCRIKGMIEN